MGKNIYMFHEGNGTMKDLLGGKGANLAEMTRIGLPVPHGFTITTEVCSYYYDNEGQLPKDLIHDIKHSIKELEALSGKGFGDPSNPLLVSVRSGSRSSMPGMMDTVLNLGLNDSVVEGLAKQTNNPRFAYDSYRRFIQMFADVVMDVPKHQFEVIIDAMKTERGIALDTEFSADDLKEMVERFKAYYAQERPEPFPTDPYDQLLAAVSSVFRSWNNDRAVYYRRMHDIPTAWGTAVNVQEMVFGNLGESCATGVAFTRNPATGDNHVFGEFLMNAQGEDVVAGTRTPQPIDKLKQFSSSIYESFIHYCNFLENHYKDMQDIEFTVENHQLYILQTRNGKRTAAAALKIAVDLVEEGVLKPEEALMQIDPRQLDTLLHPQFDEEALKDAQILGKGLAASPGAATGRIALSAKQAKQYHEAGYPTVLVRLETSPEDIEGMAVSQGILTARGGMTSHAAVVARGMGKCCVSGSADLVFDASSVTIGDKVFKEGDTVSLDGSTGMIYAGAIQTRAPELNASFQTVMTWSDQFREMGVRSNADTPKDVAQALKFGAEGIGLVRTEHMFFEEDRIMAMREMILSSDLSGRQKALETLLPIQQKDFEDIYRIVGDLPVTVRYLDPPLHEFLPTQHEACVALADHMNLSLETLQERIHKLHETNPMMGHRGVRLAITYPEIAVMQTQALIRAALNVQEELGIVLKPEIMIPLIGSVEELRYVKGIVEKTAQEEIEKSQQTLHYKVGTMIEVPRACVVADTIAQEADFISFGSNDITQYTFGFSRDDAGGFLGDYYEHAIREQDPFSRLDEQGVGVLIAQAIRLSKNEKTDIKCGLCGEHGGDPASIEFLYLQGLNYVSCSPYRVPVARLAAAQASLKHQNT